MVQSKNFLAQLIPASLGFGRNDCQLIFFSGARKKQERERESVCVCECERERERE